MPLKTLSVYFLRLAWRWSGPGWLAGIMLWFPAFAGEIADGNGVKLVPTSAGGQWAQGENTDEVELVPTDAELGPAGVEGREAEGWNGGLLYDDFRLTLAPGHRTEIAGPLFFREESEGTRVWGVPPLFSRTTNPELELEEYDVIYPLLTYDRYGGQYRWQFMQLFNLAGGETQTETNRDRFTIFPIYFQQRSSDPEENYTALFPLYGTLKHRFNRDEIQFAAFPVYAKTRRREVVTRNYLFPVFHWRTGESLRGWQVWPLAAHETKGVTTRTNGFGDITTIGGHERWNFLWPIFSDQRNYLGTANAEWQQALLPAYYLHRSPQRDQTTVLWPFFSRIEDRGKRYLEWQAPWPFIVVANGEGKKARRFWPLFGYARGSNLVTRAYLWPVYRYSHLRSAPLDRERTRILYFLYNDVSEKNLETGRTRERQALWPLYTTRRDWDGSTRLQVLALLEPILSNNKSIERNYSPLWSLWRSERNAETGDSSQSLLWNLYRRERTGATKRTSLLFGLYQHRSGPEGRKLRLFFIPLN